MFLEHQDRLFLSRPGSPGSFATSRRTFGLELLVATLRFKVCLLALELAQALSRRRPSCRRTALASRGRSARRLEGPGHLGDFGALSKLPLALRTICSGVWRRRFTWSVLLWPLSGSVGLSYGADRSQGSPQSVRELRSSGEHGKRLHVLLHRRRPRRRARVADLATLFEGTVRAR